MSGWGRAGRWAGVAAIVAVLGWGMVSRAAPARPRLALIPLAPGAAAPRIDGPDLKALEPAVIRGVRVLPVLVPEGRELEVLRAAGWAPAKSAAPAASAALAHSRGFFDPFLDAFPIVRRVARHSGDSHA